MIRWLLNCHTKLQFRLNATIRGSLSVSRNDPIWQSLRSLSVSRNDLLNHVPHINHIHHSSRHIENRSYSLSFVPTARDRFFTSSMLPTLCPSGAIQSHSLIGLYYHIHIVTLSHYHIITLLALSKIDGNAKQCPRCVEGSHSHAPCPEQN